MCCSLPPVPTTREFFEGLEARVDSGKTAGMNNSYLFDVKGAALKLQKLF
jgi:hypothetical protein